MEDKIKEVGQVIRRARKQKGITQKELGDRLGVADSVVTNYEGGKQNLTIDTLQKIAKALELELVIDIR